MLSDREKVNILMVDDMPSKLLSYEAILAELNENLIKATSAREALEHLLKKDIAVVLMDVSMPEVDGFELAAMIHDHPRHHETAIIFVSGVHLSDIDRVKAYQRGAVDYVSVPIIPEILRAKVSVFVELYRKRQQLEHVNLELERRVAERTEELQRRNEELQTLNKELRRSEESIRKSQQSLKQALAAAEQASRMKDQFLATVSHELRTPLNTILGWAQILRSGRVDPSVASGLEAIARSAKNQNQIINDLLDMERIVNGKMNLQPQFVSLTDLISSALNTLTHAITAKNIRVSSQFLEGTHNLYLYADPQRLEQVFWNVLSNAVKFSPNGGEIEIEVQRTTSEAVISFRDFGKGINADFLPFVFERFRQEDSTTTRKFGGLGLGLSIAKHLIELHGGSIIADSKGEGSGSKFSIHLPSTLFDTNVSEKQDSTELQESNQSSSFPYLSKAKVLLVDDDTQTLTMLTQALKGFAAEVRTSQSGLIALGMSNSWQPDLLISDIAMPDHDGYWLIRQIRSGKFSIRNIPAIALTAHASSGDKTEALAAGFNAFITKPVEPNEILQVANQLLESKKRTGHNSYSDNTGSNGKTVLSGKKILMLENDITLTGVIRTALESEGSQFRSAATSSEALAIAREWQPDAIISDLPLPEDDSFMERIRESAIPVFALNGEGNETIPAGFKSLRSKPFEPASLVVILADFFKPR